MINQHQILIPRTVSKQTQLMTIDSPRRRSISNVKSLHQTIQFMHKLSQSKNIILSETSSLWLQSASSIRRQKSPSHQFPTAQRFSSIEDDERKNKLILKLNIANELSNTKGVTFARSKRVDHFRPKKYFQDYPSPASYNSEIVTSRVQGRKLSTAGGKRSSLIKLSQEIMDYQIKGVTIPREKNPSKVFMHHGQKLPYQPEVTQANPGVGKYELNPQMDSFTTKKFHIGHTLKKFNEFIPRHPGPGAYGSEKQLVPKRIHSANAKGTFQLSKRTYLVQKNADQFSPSPDSYKIKRFLQK